MSIRYDKSEMSTQILEYYNTESSAQIAASYLRANGIECYVNGSILANITIFPGALQLSISVSEADYERAKELLLEL